MKILLYLLKHKNNNYNMHSSVISTVGILFERIIRSLKLVPEFRALTHDKQMLLNRVII